MITPVTPAAPPTGSSANAETPGVPATAPAGLPVTALLVMAFTGFLLIATETMPAGLLPQIAGGFGVGEATAGQLVSAYALGTVLATIPLVALTRGKRRKPVYLVGLIGILVATAVAALSPWVVLTLVARFVAGASSGLLWGMLAGYARRISAPQHAGKALAIASLGTPLGLAAGTPFGSWLGTATSWRWSFAALAGLMMITAIVALAVLPDAAGQRAESHLPVHRVFAIPGVIAILTVISTWMIAHNTVYTYIASYLDTATVDLSVHVALVIFGIAAVAGVGLTAALIDRALRPLLLSSIVGFVAAGVILLAGSGSVPAVIIAIALWGVAFGGAATQLQTAISEASGENADVANSMLGVAFNLAIFAAGVLGAVLITAADGMALPVVMIGLALVALGVAAAASRAAFPTGR